MAIIMNWCLRRKPGHPAFLRFGKPLGLVLTLSLPLQFVYEQTRQATDLKLKLSVYILKGI